MVYLDQPNCKERFLVQELLLPEKRHSYLSTFTLEIQLNAAVLPITTHVQIFFRSHASRISNYARDLVRLACFLAILFAHKGNFSSTKTC